MLFPQIVAGYDLGIEEFSTWAEMREIVRQKSQASLVPLVAVYISPFQLKLLRLEAFEKRRLTNEQARQLQFKTVLGINLFVWDGDGEPPCWSCGGRHELLD